MRRPRRPWLRRQRHPHRRPGARRQLPGCVRKDRVRFGIGCSSRFPHYMKTSTPTASTAARCPSPKASAWPARISPSSSTPATATAVWHRCGSPDSCDPLQHEPDRVPARQPNLWSDQEAGVADFADGTKSNTTPRGSYLDALNPLTVRSAYPTPSSRRRWTGSPRACSRSSRRPTTTKAFPSYASCSAARNGCPSCTRPRCRSRTACSCCTTKTHCSSVRAFQSVQKPVEARPTRHSPSPGNRFQYRCRARRDSLPEPRHT